MIIAGKLYTLYYKSRFGLLQGGDEKIVCGVRAHGGYDTDRKKYQGAFSGEQRVSEEKRSERMDADESGQYSDIRWKGEEYLDQRESDTEEGKGEELEGDGRRY